MAEKQSILGRISQLAKANINALIDRAEDPKKMLDQLVRDYTNSIAEAEEAVAQTIGNLRLAEKDYESDLAAAREWGEKAAAASKRADEATAAGNTEEADRRNNLAKVALGKQLDYRRSTNPEEMLKISKDILNKQDGLNLPSSSRKTSRSATSRCSSLIASAQAKPDTCRPRRLDLTSELSRFEDQVRRQEAMAQGRAELAADSFESQFDELEDAGTNAEIEARLAALKNKDN